MVVTKCYGTPGPMLPAPQRLGAAGGEQQQQQAHLWTGCGVCVSTHTLHSSCVSYLQHYIPFRELRACQKTDFKVQS